MQFLRAVVAKYALAEARARPAAVAEFGPEAVDLEVCSLLVAGAQFVEPGFHESYESADAWAEFVRKCGRVAT